MNVGQPRTAIEIPCCLCGTMILPNAANQCGSCLAQQFDLKAQLQRGPGGSPDIFIHQCRKCRRFKQTEKFYDHLEPESPELLALCLKRIPALSNMHLVEAMWVWTEPHSMRLRVRVTVRVEVERVMIQQRVMVEFIFKFCQCPDCNRENTNRMWHAVIQLRQKRSDERRGLFLIEAALARNENVRKHVLSMDISRHGFDFYFLNLSEAQAFAAYLSRIAPMRIKTTQKLVSTDVSNNTANLKHSVSCDMVPLCRDDLILIDKQEATGKLVGRLCLVSKVSSVVHLVDASPARNPLMDKAIDEVGSERYFKSGGEKAYRVMASPKQIIRFVVLDVELYRDLSSSASASFVNEEHVLYQGPRSGVDKFAIADVEVARETDLGSSDETFRCVTHLGNLLQVGDVVMGYDIETSVMSGGAEWSLEHGSFNSSFVMPDVVLVKKVKGSASDASLEDDELQRTTSGARLTKKKERRRKKHGKQQRKMEEAAARMGFLDDGIEAERARFEQELVDDPELALELTLAERELGDGAEDTQDGTAEETNEAEGTNEIYE